MNWIVTAAVTLTLAVGLGAFGAHGLQNRLDEYSKGIYETAVMYHFFHALGLLAIPLLIKSDLVTAGAGNLAAWLLLGGIVFFSGSLYLLAVTGVTILGAITPIGGVGFIAGWLALAYGAMR